MLKITEYLQKISEEFESRCEEGTVSMNELVKDFMGKIKNNSPKNGADEMKSIYNAPTTNLQLYLLKYAYAYAFEYLSMCNELIKDFADKEEISVVSLGCGAMLDYWALANVLDMREKEEAGKGEADKRVSWLVVKYLGIDAIEWDYSMEAEARDRDLVRLSQESFENFFKRQDNEFNDYDVYFFPKSISEINDDDMKMLLKHLSEMKKDAVYFCITLRKSDYLEDSDVRKVRRIIDKLEEEKTGFRVGELKCITDTEKTVEKLKNGLRVEDMKYTLLGKTQSGKDKRIWDTDVAENVVGYPPLPGDCYIKNLKEKCAHSSLQKDKPCEGCEYAPCGIDKEQTMTKTKYICDLIIKFERR